MKSRIVSFLKQAKICVSYWSFGRNAISC